MLIRTPQQIVKMKMATRYPMRLTCAWCGLGTRLFGRTASACFIIIERMKIIAIRIINVEKPWKKWVSISIVQAMLFGWSLKRFSKARTIKSSPSFLKVHISKHNFSARMRVLKRRTTPRKVFTVDHNKGQRERFRNSQKLTYTPKIQIIFQMKSNIILKLVYLPLHEYCSLSCPIIVLYNLLFTLKWNYLCSNGLIHSLIEIV